MEDRYLQCSSPNAVIEGVVVFKGEVTAKTNGGGGGKALLSILRGADPFSRPSVYIPSSRIIASWLQHRRGKKKNEIVRKIREGR